MLVLDRTPCVIFFVCHLVRRQESVIRGGVELCPPKPQSSTPQQSSEYNNTAGKSSEHAAMLLYLFMHKCVVCVFQEHPLLGQPFFMLHPCKTQDFMRPVLQAAQDSHR